MSQSAYGNYADQPENNTAPEQESNHDLEVPQNQQLEEYE
jgi:hypothetical protein